MTLKYINACVVLKTGHDFIFKCIYRHDWQKLQDLYTVFTLLENAFVKLSQPWHDLIINPPLSSPKFVFICLENFKAVITSPTLAELALPPLPQHSNTTMIF